MGAWRRRAEKGGHATGWKGVLRESGGRRGKVAHGTSPLMDTRSSRTAAECVEPKMIFLKTLGETRGFVLYGCHERERNVAPRLAARADTESTSTPGAATALHSTVIPAEMHAETKPQTSS